MTNIGIHSLMRKENHPMHIISIHMIAQLADLKDTDYKNTLAITALIELLIDSGLFTREDFTRKIQMLERQTVSDILRQRREKI